MYLRKFLVKSNFASAFNKTTKRSFSFFKDFNANTLAFRATKYDPSKELEVKIFYVEIKIFSS
jgi:hypothetical protein